MIKVIFFFLSLIFLFSCGKAEKSSLQPIPPTSLLAKLDTPTNSIKLTWTDNSKFEEGFVIERRTLNHDWIAIDTVEENITWNYDNKFAPNSINSYRVYAYNKNGVSEKTKEVSVSQIPEIFSPTELNAVLDSSGKSVKLTWKDNSVNEIGFIIQRQEIDGKYIILDTVISDQVSFFDLYPSKLSTRTYRVYAYKDTSVSKYIEVTKANLVTIGSELYGGVIIYIYQPDDVGFINGEIHGLIAAPSDQSTGIQWYNGSYITTGATGTALGTGMANTNAIVAAQGAGFYAAKLCADLVLNGYSDWYLPSMDELREFYINRSSIGGFPTGNCWSSSEISASGAWFISFFSGATGYASGKDATAYVRAVRAF
jgi:hypothetical protein